MTKLSDLTKIINAVDGFTQAFTDGMLASSIATNLTCEELDALARLLSITGDTEGAEFWVRMHAESETEEEDSDSHYGLDDERIADYVKDLTA